MPLYLWRRGDGRSGNWYIRGTVSAWRNGAMRKVAFKQRSTGTSVRAEAEAILTQVAARHQRGNVENRDAPPVFSDLVNAYLDAGKSDRYLAPIILALGDLEIDELTQAKIDREGRKAYPSVAPPTLRRQWHGVIQAVCGHSRVRLDLSLPEKSRSTTRFCTPKQADAIVKACETGRYKDPWKPAMAELFFGTGCRASEAFDLDGARDVSLDYGTVTFRDTKNGTERTVELAARTLEALSKLPNVGTAGPLFRKSADKLYAEKNTETGGRQLSFLRSAAKRAGVAFNPHMSRHSHATWFYAQTKDTIALRRRCGWKKGEMVDRYVHIAPPRIGEDAIALGWDFRENGGIPVEFEKQEQKRA